MRAAVWDAEPKPHFKALNGITEAQIGCVSATGGSRETEASVGGALHTCHRKRFPAIAHWNAFSKLTRRAPAHDAVRSVRECP